MDNISLRNIFKKNSILTMGAIFIPGLLFLAIMFWLTREKNIPFELFSRDPLQILNGKPYMGILSNIGIIFWCATAGILLFSVKISAFRKGPEKERYFLFICGVLTILMLVDDLFLIHDVVFPEYLKTDERVFYLFYGISVVSIFLYYRNIVLKTDYVLLILAFCAFGSSVLADILDALGLPVTQLYLFEDGLKFLGIIAWFAYFTRTSYRLIRRSLTGTSDEI